jgi:hypothetical protein
MEMLLPVVASGLMEMLQPAVASRLMELLLPAVASGLMELLLPAVARRLIQTDNRRLYASPPAPSHLTPPLGPDHQGAVLQEAVQHRQLSSTSRPAVIVGKSTARLLQHGDSMTMEYCQVHCCIECVCWCISLELMVCCRLPVQDAQQQLPPPPQDMRGMNGVYEYCNVPPEQRKKLIAALFRAGKVKAGAEYQAFQLVLQAAEAQPEVRLTAAEYQTCTWLILAAYK